MKRNGFSLTHDALTIYCKDNLQDVLGERDQRIRRMLRVSLTNFLEANPQCTSAQAEVFFSEITKSTKDAIDFIDQNSTKHFAEDLLNELHTFFDNSDGRKETEGDKILRTHYFEPRFKKANGSITAEQWKKELGELLVFIAFAQEALAKTEAKVESEVV
ncbi:MAG: hypothetical protein KA028_00475 [Candidatus Pacebacteria bacterium]|nr:hypothetical protein [Candidatus Paceibacterota bacterium]MBP9852090.1 hypothetical protein [Candidatus Paceibacterota bacterium]